MKTYFSGHFLKYIKVNLMMSNGKYEISTSHLLSPNKASSSGTGLYSTELLVNGGPMEIPKQPRLCLRHIEESHFWRQHPYNSLNKKLSWCLHGNLTHPLRSSIFVVERYSIDYQKRNININPDIKPLIYNLSHLQDIRGQWWHRTCGVIDKCLIKDQSMRHNPYPTLLG